MMRFQNRQELDQARVAYKKALDLETKKILICAGTGCVAGGSLKIYDRFLELMQERGIIRGFRTMISPQAGGKTVHGFIIGGVYSVMLYDLYRYVQTVPEVVRCETIICGGKEVILEFYCDNYDSLLKFYGSDIRKFLDSMTVYLVTDTPLKDVSIPLSSNG